MPRYFFNLYNRTGFSEDGEGQDLPNLDEARDYALKSARSILSEDVKQGSWTSKAGSTYLISPVT